MTLTFELLDPKSIPQQGASRASDVPTLVILEKIVFDLSRGKERHTYRQTTGNVISVLHCVGVSSFGIWPSLLVPNGLTVTNT